MINLNYEALKSEKHKFNVFLKGILTAIIILLLSFLIMAITFIFSSSSLNLPLFKSYFTSGGLMLMNIIPILIFMIFIYILFNRLWLSFAVSSFLFVTMSIINKFKLTYRDDPFSFIDIKLVIEGFKTNLEGS